MKPVSFTNKRQKTSSARKQKKTRKYNIVIYSSIFAGILLFIFISWLILKSVWWNDFTEKVKANVDKAIYNSSLFFGLNLQNVYLEGQNFTSPDKITELLELQENQPILVINLYKIKERLETLEWVDHVNIERQIPNTIHIRIVEKKPVAIWQHSKNLALIDKNGNIISTNHISNFVNLPIVVGDEANLSVNKLFQIVTVDENIYKQISYAIWVGKRRWNIRLQNGIEIMLPEENPQEAWKYLLELNRTKKILSRNIKSIDLRLSDRIFIKTS